MRRVALALGVVVTGLLVAGFTYGLLTPFRGVDVPDPPSCNPASTTVLVAQADATPGTRCGRAPPRTRSSTRR